MSDSECSSFGTSESDDGAERTESKNTSRPAFLKPPRRWSADNARKKASQNVNSVERRRGSAGDKCDPGSKSPCNEPRRRGSDSVLSKKKALFASGDSTSTRCSTGDEALLQDGVQSAASQWRPADHSALDSNQRRRSLGSCLDDSQRSSSKHSSGTCDPFEHFSRQGSPASLFSRQSSNGSKVHCENESSKHSSGTCDPFEHCGRQGSPASGFSRQSSNGSKVHQEKESSGDEDGNDVDEIMADPVFKAFEAEVKHSARMKFLTRQFQDVLDPLTPEVRESVQESVDKMRHEWMSAAWQRIADARERGRQCLAAEEDFRKKAEEAQTQSRHCKLMQANYLKEVAQLRDRLNHGRTVGVRDDIELWEPLSDLDPATQALVVACVEEKTKCNATASDVARKSLDSKLSKLQQEFELAEETVRKQSFEITRLTAMLNEAKAGCSQENDLFPPSLFSKKPFPQEFFSKGHGKDPSEIDDLHGDVQVKDSQSVSPKSPSAPSPRSSARQSISKSPVPVRPVGQPLAARASKRHSSRKFVSAPAAAPSTEDSSKGPTLCNDEAQELESGSSAASPTASMQLTQLTVERISEGQEFQDDTHLANLEGHTLASRQSKSHDSRKYVSEPADGPSAETASKSLTSCNDDLRCLKQVQMLQGQQVSAQIFSEGHEFQDEEIPAKPAGRTLALRPSKRHSSRKFVVPPPLASGAEAPSKSPDTCNDEAQDPEASSIAVSPNKSEGQQFQDDELVPDDFVAEDAVVSARRHQQSEEYQRPASVAQGKNRLLDQERPLPFANRRSAKSRTWHIIGDNAQAEQPFSTPGKASLKAQDLVLNAGSRIDNAQAERTLSSPRRDRGTSQDPHKGIAGTCKKSGGQLPSVARPGSRSESRASSMAQPVGFAKSAVDLEVPCADAQDNSHGRAAATSASISTGHSGVGWRKTSNRDASVDLSDSVDFGAFQSVASIGGKSQDLRIFGQRSSMESQKGGNRGPSPSSPTSSSKGGVLHWLRRPRP